jgi:hypothetical protein
VSANPDISRGESQPGSRYGLVLASFLVLATAGAVWTIRAQKSALKAQHRAQVAQIERLAETTKSTSRRESQHAVSLLIRAFLAERQTTYSALAETRAVFAGQTLKSHARITRRPDAMAIAYVKGDRSGVTLGYNQRWAWRQKNGRTDAGIRRACARIVHSCRAPHGALAGQLLGFARALRQGRGPRRGSHRDPPTALVRGD